MANDTDAGPEPAREPPRKRVNEADTTAEGLRSEATGQSRLLLQTATPSGRETVHEGDSPWQAMHRLAVWVNQDSAKARALTGISLTDHEGRFGVVFTRNDAGQMDAQFQSSDAQSMYRQVMRERQMELASPADNRISAARPQQTAASRHAEGASRSDGLSAEELRRSILANLEAPEASAQGASGGRLEGLELHRQVLERASVEQLRRLQQVADSTPSNLGEAIRKLQQQTERDIARDDPEDGKPRLSALRVWPPVDERFTVQERLGRRDYWQRDRPDRLAFTQTWLSLRTKEHGAAALLGMVDRAVELGWKRLHLEGTPEFKREAWIIATSRGIKAYGYTATLGDREAAHAERKRLSEREPARTLGQQIGTAVRAKGAQSERERDPTHSTEAWRQVVRKAIADGKAAPELEERLTQLLSREAQRRRSLGTAPIIQALDPAAARAVPKHRMPVARQKDAQRER